MNLKTAVLTLAALAACACNCPDKGSTSLSKLRKAMDEGKYMYAHQDDLCYGHNWHFNPGMSDVLEVCGDYPAIAGFDLGGLEMGDSCNLDGVDFGYMHDAVVGFARKGGIVTFSWHPRNPATGGDAWDTTMDGVVAQILPGGELNASFMDWLSRLADFMDGLKYEDGRPVEVIFRPWHENLGNWFWWCANVCTADQYKALWKMTYDYMVRERGLKALVWAYSPNAGISREEYMSTYPGDSMVDILGLDAYQYGDAESYIQLLDSHLSYMEELAAKHGKLTAVTEAGLEGIPEGDWWTGVLDKALSAHKLSYVLTWRNAWDRETHFYGPWKGAACEEDFKAFYSLDNTLFLKDIQ